MPVKKIVLLLLTGILATTIWAQENPTPKSPTAKKDKQKARREKINALIKLEEEGELVFNKQNAFGIKLNSDGYGLSFEWGRFKSPRVATIFQVELNEKKHPKEKRFSWPSGFNVNNVIFGKMNNFYQAKFAVGQQRIIGGKGNKNGVAVMAIYAGGVSAGLLKPYYVDVSHPDTREKLRLTYPAISDSGWDANVTGSAGFGTGWGELKFRPGAHAKAAMRFDWGRFNESLTALEVGLNAEFYSQKVPQMAYVKEKQFFFNAYVSLLFGRRK